MTKLDTMDETAQRLRVLWKRTLDFAVSFTTVYFESEQKFRVGDFEEDGVKWNFDRWLLVKAGLSRSSSLRLIRDLNKLITDEQREQVNAEAKVQQAVQAAVKLDAQLSQAAWDEIKAEEKKARDAVSLDAKQSQIAWDNYQDEEKDKKKAADAAQKAADDKKATKRVTDQRSRANAKLGDNKKLLAQLSKDIRNGQKQADKGLADWKEGTMKSAMAMAKARSEFPADIPFGKWLADNAIRYNTHKRAALIGIGQNPDLSRRVLGQTDSHDIPRIWNEVKILLAEPEPTDNVVPFVVS